MAPRSTGSTTISLGAMAIPIKLYAATQAQGVSFSTLHAECGARVKQQLVCPVHDRALERSETVKGFELTRGQYVTFSERELEQLEHEQNDVVELLEFVPEHSVDALYIEKTSYLAPDEGGDAAYQLLAEALRRSHTVALGRYEARGKSRAVMVRPLQRGLSLHQLYFADEVRSLDEVELGRQSPSAPAELALAQQVIEALRSDHFDARRYRDGFSARVRAAAAQKAQGLPITSAPQARPAHIADLREALEQTLRTLRAGTAEPSERVRLQGPKKARPSGDVSKRKPRTGTHD